MAEKKRPVAPSARLGSLSRLSERFSKASLAASLAASESAAELKMASAKARNSAAASLSAAKVRGTELAKRLEDNTTKATARRALESVLRDWIELGDQDDSLRVSLRKGEVLLRDAKLKPRPLFECFGIASGSISEATVTMPWTGEPAKIVASDVVVRVVGDYREQGDEISSSSRAEIIELLSSGGGGGRFFSARRLLVKALATLQIECANLRVEYSNCVVCVGSFSALAGDDYSAELQDIKMDDFVECPRLQLSVTDTLCELCSEVVAVRSSQCDAPIAAVAAFRAAQRRAELRGEGEERTRPNCAREWWKRAARACIHDKRRPLVAWWKTVDLVLLKREYVKLRSGEVVDKERLERIEATTPIRTLLAFRASDAADENVSSSSSSSGAERGNSNNSANYILSVQIDNVNFVDDNTVVSGVSFVKRDSHVLARARRAAGTLSAGSGKSEDFAIATFSDSVLCLEVKGTTCSLADAARIKTAYDYCKQITCFSKLSTIQPKAIALSVEAADLLLKTPSTRVELAKFDIDTATGLSLERDDMLVEVPTAKVDESRLVLPSVTTSVADVGFVATNAVLDAVRRTVFVKELVSSAQESPTATNLLISETKAECETLCLDLDELKKIIRLIAKLRRSANGTSTTADYQVCANDAVLSFGPSLRASASRVAYASAAQKLTADTARLLGSQGRGGEPVVVATGVGLVIADTYILESGAIVRLRPRALLKLLRGAGDSGREEGSSSFFFSASCPSSLDLCIVGEKDEVLTDVDLDQAEKSDDVVVCLEDASVGFDSRADLSVDVKLGRFETPGLRLTNLLATVRADTVTIGLDTAALSFSSDGCLNQISAATARAFEAMTHKSTSERSSSRESDASSLTTTVTVNRVDITGEAVRIRGSGVSAVFSPRSTLSLQVDVESVEAAIFDVQLVEPATLRIERIGKTVEAKIVAAVKSGEPVIVYVSPQDVRQLSRALTAARETLYPLFAVLETEDHGEDDVAAWSVAIRGRATLSVVAGCTPRACPALAFDLSEPILDARRNSVTVTVGLEGIRTFDSELERWERCMLVKSGRTISVCAQSIDTDLRVCVGGEMLNLRLEPSMAASIARIAIADDETNERDGSVFPDVEIRNAYGKSLEVDGMTLRNGETRMRPPPPIDTKRDAIGDARDGSPAHRILVHDEDTHTLFEVPLPRSALSAPENETTSLLITAEEYNRFLVAEYTKRDGFIVVSFRSAARLVNRCRCALECELLEADQVVFRATVDKSMELPTTRDTTVRVRRLDDDGTSDWVECGTIRDCLRLAVAKHRRRPNRETNNLYRRGATNHTASVRWFAVAQDSAGAIMVCPARTLTNRLPRRVRIATARAWPRSRDDYAAVYNLGPFESCDLRLVDARYWCARLDGYDAQSEWVDTAAVSATDPLPAGANDSRMEAARFVLCTAGNDGNEDDFEYGVWTSDSLALELVRAPAPKNANDESAEEQAAGVVNLELCCQLLCVDNNTGLGLDFLGRSEASMSSSRGGGGVQPAWDDSSLSLRHKMMDVSPHSAMVLEATARRNEHSGLTAGAIGAAPRSSPIVPAAALASRPAKDGRDAVVALVPPQRGSGGLLEVSFRERFCGRQRVIDFCPRIALSHRASCGDLDLVARQAATRDELSTICARAKPGGEAVPFYWTRSSAPFALQLAWMPCDGGNDSARWTPAIHPRVFEESDGDDVVLVELPPPMSSMKASNPVVLRLRRGSSGAASFELVAADIKLEETFPIPRPQQLQPKKAPKPTFRSVRFELEAVGVRLAELEFACPRGVTMAWSTKKDDTRLASIELKKPVSIRDCTARTPEAFSSRGDPSLPAFKTTVRLREQLAGAIEVGDAAICLSEAAVWRVFDSMRRASAMCEFEQRGRTFTKSQRLIDVEVVRVSALCLSPATLVADVTARRELARSLSAAEQGGAGGPWTTRVSLGLLSAFPKLALENAEVNFDACDVRPRPSILPAGDLAAMVVDAYASQLKQRWWALASSISLSGASSIGVGGGGGFPPPTPHQHRQQPAPRRQEPLPSSFQKEGAVRGSDDEYEIVVESQGSLGLVIVWREADGVPLVTERKPPGSPAVTTALKSVGVGDVIVSVNGRPGGSHTTDELVQIMRRRPLSLILKKKAPAPLRVELVVPKTEPSLGFSVGRDSRGQGLVVTQVRVGSVLDRNRIGTGSRLLKVNGRDVSRLSLDELTAICRSLVDTDRTLLLEPGENNDDDDDDEECKEETSTNPFAAAAGAAVASVVARPSPSAGVVSIFD